MQHAWEYSGDRKTLGGVSMGRKKKRRRFKPHGHDKHHLLFYRAEWNRGYNQLLRRVFIYDIPMPVHQALHSSVGKVPPLDEQESKWLWERYRNVDHELDLYEALAWLENNAPNVEFATAIAAQRDFLENNLEG